MMNGMGGLEDGGPVHPAMRPVEPGVVRDQIEQHRNRPVPERIAMDIRIDPRPAAILPAPGDDPRRHAVNGGGGQTPGDFAPDLRIEAGIEVRMPRLGRQRESARGEQIADTDDQRHGDGGQDQGKRHGSLVPYRGRGLNRGRLVPRRFVRAEARRRREVWSASALRLSSYLARGGGVRALVCPRQTKIVPGAQSRSNTKLVEGCHRLDSGTPLRQGFALPPPLAGEE